MISSIQFLFKLKTSKKVGRNTLARTYGNKKINSPERISNDKLKKDPFLILEFFNGNVFIN